MTTAGIIVSVPFRGLGSEKLSIEIVEFHYLYSEVSVPFRGLGSEKPPRGIWHLGR